MATCSSATATERVPRLRDASEDDAPAIAAIYSLEVLHGTATYEVAPPDADAIAARIRAGLGAGYPWRVATIGRDLAGYAYASAYRSRPGYQWTVENSVYVATRHRGTGVGRALLDDLVALCTSAGYRQMIAVIGDDANTASIALHERAGFRVAARFPGIGRKHGRWLTGVQMMRALGDGDSTPPFAEPGASA